MTLSKDIVEMFLDRTFGERKPLGDLLVPQPLAHDLNDSLSRSLIRLIFPTLEMVPVSSSRALTALLSI
jgi:hypothetical protein